MIDFTYYKLSNIKYGGSEKKIGILVDECPYMLKFQKNEPFGLRFNHISEYLGSHIFGFLGFDVHQTFLGTYDGKNVVACKDFTIDGYKFVPFNDVGESTIEADKETYQYSYQDIITLLEKNRKITNVDQTISSFFEIYIVDALLGNFDRHGSNWGFLKKDDKYKLAPVFDNGSCLYPQLIDENEMIYIMNNEEEINRRIYKFPTSQIKLHGEKSSYFEVISSLEFEECNKALVKVYKRIDLDAISKIIDNTETISDIRKDFYKTMIKNRYEKIIKYSYLKLLEKEDGQYN